MVYGTRCFPWPFISSPSIVREIGHIRKSFLAIRQPWFLSVTTTGILLMIKQVPFLLSVSGGFQAPNVRAMWFDYIWSRRLDESCRDGMPSLSTAPFSQYAITYSSKRPLGGYPFWGKLCGPTVNLWGIRWIHITLFTKYHCVRWKL